jgi:glucokinase
VVEYLKIGIQNYINLYAPDKIILGGGVSKGLHNYLPILQENTHLGPFKQYKTHIEISELEEHAGILGSAALFN